MWDVLILVFSCISTKTCSFLDKLFLAWWWSWTRINFHQDSFGFSLEVVCGPLIIPSGKGEGALETCINSVHISKAELFLKMLPVFLPFFSPLLFSLNLDMNFCKVQRVKEGQWESMHEYLLKNYSQSPSSCVHWLYHAILCYEMERFVFIFEMVDLGISQCDYA